MKARTRFPSAVVARIWDWLRTSFKVDWSRVKNKREVDRLIGEKKRTMLQVLKGQKTLSGVTKKQAGREVANINKASTVMKRGWYQIKPLARSSIRQTAKTGKTYVRNYQPWGTTKASRDMRLRFISERKGMPSKPLRDSYNIHFGESRTLSQISVMKSRVKTGKVKFK